MNRATHAMVGAVVGGAVYWGACKLLNHQPELGGLLLSAGLGAAAACLHDLLEPAIHPNHRSIVHGVALNGALAVGMRHLWLRAEAEPGQRALWASVALACLSHAALDVTTPKGLPFLW